MYGKSLTHKTTTKFFPDKLTAFFPSIFWGQQKSEHGLLTSNDAKIEEILPKYFDNCP
jgi:hypothetical protein